MAIDPDVAAFFDVFKKDKAVAGKVWHGDDLSMDSVAPFGIPTGIPELDLQLGQKGGYPVGKIIELFGFERCGKTTAALQAAAEWQRRNGIVFFIDTEKSYDPVRARQLGVDTEQVVVMEADTVEEIFAHIIDRILEPAKKSGLTRPVLIIVDSVNGVPTAADMEGNIDANDRVGFEAKQIKRGCRKINPVLSDYDFHPTLIFINHASAQIDKHKNSPIESGGGHGVKFYASVRISFAHFTMARNKDGEREGQQVSINISKLKGAALEHDKLSITLDNDFGFNKYKSLLQAMIQTKYASRQPKSQFTTLFVGTESEEEIKSLEFPEWCESHGGYDAVYMAWRRYAIKKEFIKPWGGKE